MLITLSECVNRLKAALQKMNRASYYIPDGNNDDETQATSSSILTRPAIILAKFTLISIFDHRTQSKQPFIVLMYINETSSSATFSHAEKYTLSN